MKKVWTVVNDEDPNETFEVEGETYEEAAHEALETLGWWLATPEEEESDTDDDDNDDDDDDDEQFFSE